MKYEYLEHTADLKIKAYGQNLEEAFANAALGTFNFLIDTQKVKSIENKTINVKSNKIESLLYDFLEELLFLLDTDGFLLHAITNMKIQETEKGYTLEAEIEGDLAEHGYETKGNIKSITYSEMKIKQEENNCEIIFVVDI